MLAPLSKVPFKLPTSVCRAVTSGESVGSLHAVRLDKACVCCELSRVYNLCVPMVLKRILCGHGSILCVPMVLNHNPAACAHISVPLVLNCNQLRALTYISVRSA